MKNYAKSYLKSSNGITLIALVITIIVLLILAGISISMLSGDNGILQKSTEAKISSEKAEAKEQARIDIMAWITDKTANHQDTSLDDEKVKEILTGKSYVKNGQPGNNSFFTAKGEYEIPYSELYIASDTTIMATLPAGTYTSGEEVTFGGEQFFVIADDGERVRLLAKYCLNQEGTAQTDKNATDNGIDSTYNYGRKFSQTNYWSDNFTSSPFDLQSEEMIEEAESDGTTIQNAVLTAREYGNTKGVPGRLMTKTEADTMKLSNGEIMYGKWTDGTQPTIALSWWLGDSNGTTWVWYVYGQGNKLGKQNDYFIPYAGVRPVLIVPES